MNDPRESILLKRLDSASRWKLCCVWLIFVKNRDKTPSLVNIVILKVHQSNDGHKSVQVKCCDQKPLDESCKTLFTIMILLLELFETISLSYKSSNKVNNSFVR